MNTTENNKLIAEFMGIRPRLISPDVYGFSDLPYFSTTADTPEKVMESIGTYVKYDSSWDWLMPVVDGILNASLPLTMDNPINQKRIEIFKNVNLYSSIDKVYNACIEFIKWYNKQK